MIAEKYMLSAMRTEFGKRLVEARKRAKKTQHQVAKACGMSQSNYAQMETVAAGSVHTPAVAEYLGVDVQWLAYGAGSPDQKFTPATQSQHLSPSAQNLGEWLDKIKDPDRHYRIAHAAMVLILEELDGPRTRPTPTPTPAKEKQRA